MRSEQRKIPPKLQTGPQSNFKLENSQEKMSFYIGLNKLHADGMLFLDSSDSICCSILYFTVTNGIFWWNSILGSSRKKLAAISKIPLKTNNINIYPQGIKGILLPSKLVPKELCEVLGRSLAW